MSSAGTDFVKRLKKLQPDMLVDESMLANLVDLEVVKSKARVIRDFSEMYASEEASKFADSLDKYAKSYEDKMEVS